MRALVLALAILAAPATAQTYSSARGTVSFTSQVPLHTFTGTSRHLNGELDLTSQTVDFYVDLETLETGIGKRDRDMRDALETRRFPFAEFTGRLTTPLNRSQRTPQRARVNGTFTVHGVTRPLTLDGTIEPTPQGLRVRAEWEVRLDDHEIEPPRLLMVKVNQVQTVEIDILLSPS